MLSEIRPTWHLAWPIVVTQLAQFGASCVDAIMAGHASAEDLAAVSVGSAIWGVMMLTLVGITMSINPLVSHHVGAQERKPIAMLVQQGLQQSLLVSLLWLLLAWLSLPIFNLLGLAPIVASKAQGFLLAIAAGFPALAWYRTLGGYSASLGRTKPMMLIALFGLALNIPLNWALIYGHMGFPALGAVGCGYATATCLWIAAGFLTLWIRLHPHYQDTQPFSHWHGIHWAQHRQLFRLGAPIAAVFFVESSAFSLIAWLIAPLGTITVAAHQIALNCAGLVFMLPAAMGQALTVRVGHALGARQIAQARAIGHSGLVLGVIYGLIAAVLLASLREPITTLYTSSEPVQHLATALLFYVAIFQLADSSQTIMSGILRGYKITRVPMLCYIVAFWLIGLPLGYALAYGKIGFIAWGVSGYWLALAIALLIVCGLLWLLYQHTLKRMANNSIP